MMVMIGYAPGLRSHIGIAPRIVRLFPNNKPDSSALPVLLPRVLSFGECYGPDRHAAEFLFRP